MVKPCPALRSPCYLEECQKGGCKKKLLDAPKHIENKPKAIYCNLQHQICYLDWCLENRACFSKSGKTDATTNDEKETKVAAKSFMVCPCAMPNEANVCYDKGCLETGKCQDAAFGAIEVNGQAVTKTGTWTCPSDKAVCQMIDCNGGASCFMHRNKGVAFVPKTKDCHAGMNTLGFIGKAEIMLGRQASALAWDVDKDGPIALIIGLLGDPYPQGPAVGINNEAMTINGIDKLLYMQQPAPNMWIKWPDYGVVPFDKAWWERLVTLISKLDGAVLVYCMGGHGRTGTAGTIIGCLGGIVPAEAPCPIEWVREKYCEKAVESDSQVAYIEKITGRKVSAEKAKSAVGGYYGGHSVGPTYGSIAQKKSLGGLHHGVSLKKNKPKADPQRLSIKKWKQWWRTQDKRGTYKAIEQITRPKDLPDGQVFKIGKRSWRWCLNEHIFEEVKNAKPAEANKEALPKD